MQPNHLALGVSNFSFRSFTSKLEMTKKLVSLVCLFKKSCFSKFKTKSIYLGSTTEKNLFT